MPHLGVCDVGQATTELCDANPLGQEVRGHVLVGDVLRADDALLLAHFDGVVSHEEVAGASGGSFEVDDLLVAQVVGGERNWIW